MSLEAEITANAGVQDTAQDAQGESGVDADIQAALEKDPQRILAKKVQADLDEAGVGGSASKPPEEAAAKQEEFDAEKQRIAQALAKRTATFKEREASRQEAETIKAEALRMKQEADRYAAQIRQQAAQTAQFQKLLKENPAQAMRMAGLDPEEFIMNLAREGTPEGQLEKRLREQNEKIAEFERWKQEQATAAERARLEYQQRQQMQRRNQVETQFLEAATSEKYSAVSKALEVGLVSRKSLIAEGDEIADKYREATGMEASREDILEYIDSQVAQAISKLSGTSQVKVPQTPGTAKPQAQTAGKPAKVGKTLSADDASERRTLERDLTDADSEERRVAARAAVRAVLDKARKEE